MRRVYVQVFTSFPGRKRCSISHQARFNSHPFERVSSPSAPSPFPSCSRVCTRRKRRGSPGVILARTLAPFQPSSLEAGSNTVPSDVGKVEEVGSRRPGAYWSWCDEPCHRSVTNPVIVVVVVDAVEVVGTVVAAFSNGCSGCLGVVLTILDS